MTKDDEYGTILKRTVAISVTLDVETLDVGTKYTKHIHRSSKQGHHQNWLIISSSI